MSKPLEVHKPGSIIVGNKPWLYFSPSKRPVTEVRPYTGKLEPLTVQDFDYFQQKYGIVTPNGRIFRGDEDRYVMPIFAPANALARGHVSRIPWPGSPLDKLHDRAQLKANTFMATRDPVQSFYKAHGPQLQLLPLVIVEDQLSAIKLAEIGLNAMAILGTPNKGEIGMDKLSELTRIYNSETIVALDADATEQAFEFARKWGSAFKKLRVAILQKDIKDTPKAEIFGVLGL